MRLDVGKDRRLGFLIGFGHTLLIALIGYCPGTAAAAAGQGSWDALFGMAGLVAGSWLYAEMSSSLKQTLEKMRDLGKLTFYDVLPLPKLAVTLSAAGLSTALRQLIQNLNPGNTRHYYV